jgi:hypothetical protein
MNKEQTQAAMAIMQAFLDGKEIEFSSKHCDTWLSLMESQISWNWSDLKYRVKPIVVKYRRALMLNRVGMQTGEHYITLCLPSNDCEKLAASAHFVRWIDTEWVEEIV